MADGGVFVHQAAVDAHAQITRLFDFMSPTIIAMWNLRWQVQGFVQAYPDATQQDVVKRFALGSGVRGNEILRATVEVSWQEQRDRFSAIILTNTIAIFEDFTDQLAERSLTGTSRDAAAKALQFPTKSGSDGYLKAYRSLNIVTPELTGVFAPAAKAGRWYSGPTVQNLLLCYRYFKEVRNALAHGGGRAGQKLIDAYAAFAPVAAADKLGMDRVPAHVPPELNKAVRLDPEGVNWFCNVVLRLIATFDADLAESQGALREVDERLPGVPKGQRSPIGDVTKKDRRIAKLATQGRFPRSVLTPAYVQYLRDTDRIPAYW